MWVVTNWWIKKGNVYIKNYTRYNYISRYYCVMAEEEECFCIPQ